eukprot:3167474-Pyramimonas_sp.AAC.1
MCIRDRRSAPSCSSLPSHSRSAVLWMVDSLPAVNRPTQTVNQPSPAASHPPQTMNCPPQTVNRPPQTVNRPPHKVN